MRTGTETSIGIRFRAMGADVHITIVDGPDPLLDLGRHMIDELEGRWSRFRPDSEVSALNHHAGHPVLVSADTYGLVTKALAAWRATDGRFDPTIGAALIAHGYDRDFAVVRAARPETRSVRPAPSPAGIQLDPAVGAITLPEGVTFDPGGIGKGLAADLVAAVLLEAGARGALVNIGGDLRAIGEAPGEDGWVITICEPADPEAELLRLSIPEGAVATSSSLRRRWQTSAGEAHHLIEPATGQPVDSAVHSVTVVAAEAWWAEVLTKSLYLLGPAGLASIDDAHAVIVMADGTRHSTDGISGALR
jgi:thiamine biosynthesis lipoprotein